MEAYTIKMNKHINNLRKIYMNYFQLHDDFKRENRDIIEEIKTAVKDSLHSILLSPLMTTGLIEETYNKYRINNPASKNEISTLLKRIYGDIIVDTYKYLYEIT